MSPPRPLSPHLQVYRLPLTGLVSISHRITGLFLSLGLLLCVYLLLAIALGPVPYQAMQTLMATWMGKLVFWGFAYALFFHLCHGVRHLLWDVGKTYDKASLTGYAILEVVLSVLLTLMTWFLLS